MRSRSHNRGKLVATVGGDVRPAAKVPQRGVARSVGCEESIRDGYAKMPTRDHIMWCIWKERIYSFRDCQTYLLMEKVKDGVAWSEIGIFHGPRTGWDVVLSRKKSEGGADTGAGQGHTPASARPARHSVTSSRNNNCTHGEWLQRLSRPHEPR